MLNFRKNWWTDSDKRLLLILGWRHGRMHRQAWNHRPSIPGGPNRASFYAISMKQNTETTFSNAISVRLVKSYGALVPPSMGNTLALISKNLIRSLPLMWCFLPPPPPHPLPIFKGHILFGNYMHCTLKVGLSPFKKKKNYLLQW